MMFSLKPILPKTLFGRSLMIIVVPVLLLQFIATYIFYNRHWDRMADQLAAGVVAQVSYVLDSMEQQYPISDQGFDYLATMTARHLGMVIDLDRNNYEVEQAPIEGWRSRLAINSLHDVIERQIESPVALSMSMDGKWVNIDVVTASGVLHVRVSERRVFNSSSYIFVLWMIGVSIALFSIAIIFMRNQIRPIRRLAIAADWFGRGRDVSKFKPEGALEVRQAANAFLTMRDRIKRQISQRTEMLAGVSHDLRTPLTRLKLGLELMDDKEAKAMRADIEDMEEMIEAYLDFVRTEGQEEPEIVHVKEVIDKVVLDAQRQKIDIKSSLSDRAEDVTIWLRSNSFSRALMNVIQNAHRYAKKIALTADVSAQDGLYTIIVDDDGPGIPEVQREDVFKPFYRIEGSRNKKTGGVGLGLSIVQDVIHSHGGMVSLEDSPMGGLRVRISLPV